MNNEDFVKLVVESLEAIIQPYRQPYEEYLYERILCYEFYHQFRSRMENSCSFVLHGELEKGYRGIEKIPDFVFHVPKTDDKNLATIEFKSTKYSISILKEDLRKLSEFRSEPLLYQLGVFVLFGPQEDLNNKFDRLIKTNRASNVELLMIAYDVQSGKVIKTKSL